LIYVITSLTVAFFCSNWVGLSFRYVAEGTNFVLILQLQTENLSNYFYIIMLTIQFKKFRPPNPAISVAITWVFHFVNNFIFSKPRLLTFYNPPDTRMGFGAVCNVCQQCWGIKACTSVGPRLVQSYKPCGNDFKKERWF